MQTSGMLFREVVLDSEGLISFLQELNCWISEGNRKADYKMRASLSNTSILIISVH